MINFIKRYCENDKHEMGLIINEKFINIIFCDLCGNYIKKLNELSMNKYLYCFHDERLYLYKLYKEVIENFEKYTSGDAFDEYIEYPNGISKYWKIYIYSIVLFGFTYKKNYYNKIDDNIKKNILKYIT